MSRNSTFLLSASNVSKYGHCMVCGRTVTLRTCVVVCLYSLVLIHDCDCPNTVIFFHKQFLKTDIYLWLWIVSMVTKWT